MRFWAGHPTPAGLVPLGIPNPSRGSPNPPCSRREGGLHPQLSCNALNWEHCRPCLILSLSKSFPALGSLGEPGGVPLTKPSQKSSTTTHKGDPPHPCELQPLLHPGQGRGLWGPCSRPGTSAPQFPLTLSFPCSEAGLLRSPSFPFCPQNYKISLTNR